MTKSKHSQPRDASRKLPVPWPILVLIALVIGAAGYSVMAPRAHAAAHPHPRADASAERLRPPAEFASDPRIAEIYAQVARIPQVVDGIYCYCHCSRHAGHYSLLSCFEDEHGANCEVCLEQAALAYRMVQQGRSLEEIRAAVDARYGRKG